VKFPFICSNIPSAPAYGVNISQLIQYSRACGSEQVWINLIKITSPHLLIFVFGLTVAVAKPSKNKGARVDI
jgi:hypothetical protein